MRSWRVNSHKVKDKPPFMYTVATQETDAILRLPTPCIMRRSGNYSRPNKIKLADFVPARSDPIGDNRVDRRPIVGCEFCGLTRHGQMASEFAL